MLFDRLQVHFDYLQVPSWAKTCRLVTSLDVITNGDNVGTRLGGSHAWVALTNVQQIRIPQP